MERLDYIDHACLDLLMNWEKQHEATGGRLVIDWDYLTAKFHREETAHRQPVIGGSPEFAASEEERLAGAMTA
jgi:hypothetical protein